MTRIEQITKRLEDVVKEYPTPWTIYQTNRDGKVLDALGHRVVGGEIYEGYMSADSPHTIMISNAPSDIQYLLEQLALHK